MSTQYAFFFDAKFCSGCKACQVACKDKNNLPPGVLWRRVIEVAGGTWQADGAAWNNSVFAYNLSLSCNHCLHPKCAGICPTNAYHVREDGIVVLDESKCMGCGYCAWGCPYDAPQYNPEAGRMTKCDFCFDNLEQGLPPACVAACPLRVLNYGEMTAADAASDNEIILWDVPAVTHPFPLPVYSHTGPRLAIKQHGAMNSTAEKFLGNTEEVRPRPPSPWEDVPLMLFTLLGQMATGGVWAIAWMIPSLWFPGSYGEMVVQLIPTLLAGACLGAGMLASLAHLGTKKNAVRIFSNLRHSSLSKEVMYACLFGLGLLLMIFRGVVLGHNFMLWTALTGIAGLGLVHNMAQVYRLPAAPGWNTWRTNAGFLISALLLGTAVMTPLLAYGSSINSIQVPSGQWRLTGISILALLLAQLVLMRKRPSQIPAHEIRLGLIVTGVALTALTVFQSNLNLPWISAILLLIVVGEESLGRWCFYQSRL